MFSLTLTERRRNILSGMISVVLLFGLISFGVKFAFGALDDGYELSGTFSSAGQGLIAGSDVKIRGINVGHVQSIRLVEGSAEVTIFVNHDVRVPTTAAAFIRAKTLFGEKFVDLVPGEHETTGPYLQDHDKIDDTHSAFELEAVLRDIEPIFRKIDPEEFVTVLHGFAESGRGLGPAINASLVNAKTLTDLQVANDAQTRQFLTDLALLSDTLADHGDDLIGMADDLNIALPTINDRADEFNELLVQLGRVSRDAADVLDNNHAFLHDSVVEGGKGLQVLSDRRGQIVPLVQGMRRYLQTVASSIRISEGLTDGSLMAAVKGIMGADACKPHCPGASASAPAGATSGDLVPAVDPVTGLPTLDGILSTRPVSGGTAVVAILDSFRGAS